MLTLYFTFYFTFTQNL